MSPRHFHKMMSPQFFVNPEASHNKKSAQAEEKIEKAVKNFFRKLNIFRFFK